MGVDDNHEMLDGSLGAKAPVTSRFDVAFYVPSATGLFLHGSELPPGGAETQQLILARELARRGYRVAMIVDGDPDVLPKQHDGVFISALPLPKPRPPVLRNLSSLVRTIRMLRAARARTYVRRGLAGMTGVVAVWAKLIRARFVFAAASAVDFDPKEREPDPKRVRMYRLGVRLADTIVVQTNEQAARCGERFGRNARVIRSIAEPRPQRTHVPDGFLWVGRAIEHKRPELYLELARSMPDALFRMIAVPSPADRAGLAEQLQRDARTIANLELLAPRPREAMDALYDSTVAIVSTSSHEGMPNVFLEAWTHGVPALCLSCDPDGIVVRERLGGFANGSMRRMIELARETWDGRDDQAEIAARCRDYVAREHGVDVNVRRWIDVLGIGAAPSPADAGETRAAMATADGKPR